MGVYRNISVFFWNDSKIEDSFSPEDKYFYLYLLTNPRTNICGCYELSSRQACVETGYNQDTVSVLLRRLEETHKVIRYDRETKEVLIVNWYKYNWTTSVKVKTAVLSVAKYIASDPLREYVINTIENLSELKKERTKEINIRAEAVAVAETDTKSTVSVSTDDGIQYEYDIDTVSRKPEKHKYGANCNVLLSDEEYQKLQENFPMDYEKRIDNLSYYIASKGNKYKSHYMTILNWARKESAEKTKGRSDWIDDI